jgi:hypothetical protein
VNPPDAMLEHRIRQRAYEIYHARLENPALYDWLQAEHEILKETKQFDRSQFESEAGPKKSGESRVVLNPIGIAPNASADTKKKAKI